MGYILSLKVWDEEKTNDEVGFSRISFRIQVHKVPLEMQTEQNAKKIGGVIVKVVEIEDPTRVKGMGRVFLG